MKTKHPLYKRWRGMKTRCTNPNQYAFKDYGAKGIGVCSEWDDFWKFVEDMGPVPFIGATVERKNNSLGYSKENCKWASRKEQSRNTSKNIFVTVGDITLTVCDWEIRNGVRRYTYYQRIGKLGWDPVLAVTTPVAPNLKNRKENPKL